MKAKVFLIVALASALFTGCGDDMPGSSTVGNGDEYDARADKYSYGETDIPGLYATLISFYFEKSNNPDDYLKIDITLFHDTPEFEPGDYTFPSTGAETASGVVYAGDNSGKIHSGELVITETGGKYKYTFNAKNIVYGFSDTETRTTNFTYRGDMPDPDFPPGGDVPMPEFSGKSTIVETETGRTVENMDFYVNYYGFSEETGLHRNEIQLGSGMIPLDDGSRFGTQISLYSEARELTSGTYTASGTGAWTFDGNMGFVDRDGYVEMIENPAGEIVVSESNGVYTIRFNEVTGEVAGDRFGDIMTFDGAYIGVCFEFRDMSE